MKSIYKLSTVIAICALYFIPQLSIAQNVRYDDMTLSYLDIIRYHRVGLSGGVASTAAPGLGMTSYVGAGTNLWNPAATALAEKGYLDIDLNYNSTTSKGDFFLSGNPQSYDNTTASKFGINSINYMYKFPTSQGSIVLGGGYIRHTSFQNSVEASGFNDYTSITDMYVDDSFYNNVAIDGGAIGYTSVYNGTDTTDVLDTVLRFGENGFEGIYQNMKMTKEGNYGEFNLYGATEFQEDFYLGASLSIPVGNYKFKRYFTELDLDDVYNYDVTDFDINSIESFTELDIDYSGLQLTLGAVKDFGLSSFGVSYTLPSKLTIEESGNIRVEAIYDTPLPEDGPAEESFSDKYEITRPGILKLGVNLSPTPDFILAASMDYTNYGNLEYKFDDARTKEISLNDKIDEELGEVYNYSISAKYTIRPDLSVFAGYRYEDSPEKNNDTKLNIRKTYSLGAEFKLNYEWNLFVTAAYSEWKDEYLAYYTPYFGADVVASQNISRLNTMIGFSYHF